MSDIRFEGWLHRSGTGGVYQDSAGNVGIASTQPQTRLDIGNGGFQVGPTGIATVTTVNTTNLVNASPLSYRNLVTNGKFDIFQRNLSGSVVTCNSGSNTYCMDRWYARGESSLGVFTLKQEDITSNAAGVAHAAKVTVTTNAATPGSGDVYKIAHRIEGRDVAHLELGRATAKSFTLSFSVKSSVTGTHSGSFMNSAQNQSFPFTYTINSADTWEDKVVNVPARTSGSWVVNNGIGLELNFDMGSGSGKRGTAGQWAGARAEGATGAVQVISTSSATWFVTKVQIEEGDVATPFEHRYFGEEMARCQRYYYMHVKGTDNSVATATVYQNNNLFPIVQFPCRMRAEPSLDVADGTSYFRAYANGGSDGFDTFSSIWNPSNTTAGLNAYSNDGVSGLSAGHSSMIITEHASAHVAFSADL